VLRVTPAVLQADGTGAVSIQYQVANAATVSLALHASDGSVLLLRDRVPRGPGTYSFDFQGAVDGRVLPDGEYMVVATAQNSATGEQTEQRQPLTLANADTEPPAIEGLQFSPAVLSPNQDGVDDRLEVNFSAGEPLTIEARLIANNDVRLLVEDLVVGPGVAHFSWPSPLRHAPQINQAVAELPTGSATLEVSASDRAGNRTVARTTIEVGESGIPRARITNVLISPTSAHPGEKITVTATIANTGAVTLRATPPGPATYSWGEDAHALGFAAATGTVRWGVDFSLNRSGVAYPFRWSLGRDLAPGESVHVSGSIRLNDHFPQEPVQLWVGVIHEDNRMLADKRGVTRIERSSGTTSQ
jgi:hypothetical protein